MKIPKNVTLHLGVQLRLQVGITIVVIPHKLGYNPYNFNYGEIM